MYCPKCGNDTALIKVNEQEVYVCKDSSCRTSIHANRVNKINVSAYATMSMNFDNSDNSEGYYILLKSDIDEPLIVKNTNKPISEKNRLCILRAKSKQDAIKQFKGMFELIPINEDTVRKVRLNISNF